MGGGDTRFRQGDESFHALVELSPDAILVFRDGKRVFCNRAGLTFTGAGKVDDIAGRPIGDFFPPEQHRLLAQRAKEMPKNGQPAPPVKFSARLADGTVVELACSAAPIAAFGGKAMLVIARDETALRDSEQRRRDMQMRIEQSRHMLETQNRLIRRVAAGEPAQAIFDAACDSVESTIAGAKAAIFLLGDDRSSLRNVAAPSLPERFRDNCRQVSVDPAQVPCGLAAQSAKTVIVSDFSAETRWVPYLERLNRYGLCAEWVVPMFSADGRLLGTLVVYHGAPATPSDEALAFLEEVAHTLGVALQKQQIERRFGESRELHRVVVDGLAEGVVVIDSGHRVLMANPAAYEILRLKGMAIEGNTVDPDKLFKATLDEHGESISFEDWPYVRALRTGQSQLNVPMGIIAKDGELVWVSVNAIPMGRTEGSKPDMVVVSFEDITSVRDAESRLHYVANHDSLTHLPNRAYLQDYMNRAIDRARRWHSQIGVLFVDLDRFKNVNDNLGHTVGDQLLRDVATRLQRCMRQSDIVVRHGGDEFIVITEELSGEASMVQVAERIIEALTKPFIVAEHELFLGASVGIAVYPNDSADTHTLLRNADVAMYQAKARGGNSYEFFTAEINDSAKRRFSLELGLRRALERDEFRLVYQPRARVSDDRIQGVEALLRWDSRDHGQVMPKDFVPLLEHSGLIVPVGRWVLEQACRQVADWQASGLGTINVAVNVSARQLRTPSLAGDVENALRESGIPGQRLELELTESMLTSDTREIGELFDALKRLGVDIAIDDFGTGYSSLAYLSRFPIDRLKIDQSFTAGIPDSTYATEITQTIIAMARGLGMSVVAEGVETRPQLDFLQARGCDEYQGYLLSRPVAAAEIERLLRTRG